MESYWICLAVIDANMGHGIGRIVEEKIVERIGVLLLFFLLLCSLVSMIRDSCKGLDASLRGGVISKKTGEKIRS